MLKHGKETSINVAVNMRFAGTQSTFSSQRIDIMLKFRGPGKYGKTRRHKYTKVAHPDIVSAVRRGKPIPENYLSFRPSSRRMHMYHTYKIIQSPGHTINGWWTEKNLPPSALKRRTLRHNNLRLTLSARATRKLKNAYAKIKYQRSRRCKR